MRYLAMDQNKWSQLETACLNPDRYPIVYDALCTISDLVHKGSLRVQILNSNIFETQKLECAASKQSRARLLNSLSHGCFLVGSDYRRRAEVASVLARDFCKNPLKLPEEWFISPRFWEATSAAKINVPLLFKKYAEKHPEAAFYSYLCNDGEVHIPALDRYNKGSKALLERIEKRRERSRRETLSLRRKALSVLLFDDHQEEFIRIRDELGISDHEFRVSPDPVKRNLIRDVPTLFVERELALLLEAETGALKLSDLQDMQFYTAAIPYADIIVGEKAFVNRAKQAKLDEKFAVSLFSNFNNIVKVLS